MPDQANSEPRRPDPAPEYYELVDAMGFGNTVSMLIQQRLTDRGSAAKLLALHFTSDEFKTKISHACARVLSVHLSLADARATIAILRDPLLKHLQDLEERVSEGLQPELEKIFAEIDHKLAAL